MKTDAHEITTPLSPDNAGVSSRFSAKAIKAQADQHSTPPFRIILELPDWSPPDWSHLGDHAGVTQ